MKHGDIGRVADGAEDSPLFGETGRRAGPAPVGMGGDDDVGEHLAAAVRILDDRQAAMARDASRRRTHRYVRYVPPHRGNVLPAAAADRAPLHTVGDLQQAMAAKEPQERAHWIVADFCRGGRPDRRAHGQHMLVDQRRRVALAREEIAQTDAVDVRLIELACLPVEPEDVADHAPEARTDEVCRLSKQAVRAARIFKPPVPDRNAKRHVGIVARDAEVVEQRREVGIVDGL